MAEIFEVEVRPKFKSTLIDLRTEKFVTCARLYKSARKFEKIILFFEKLKKIVYFDSLRTKMTSV